MKWSLAAKSLRDQDGPNSMILNPPVKAVSHDYEIIFLEIMRFVLNYDGPVVL